MQIKIGATFALFYINFKDTTHTTLIKHYTSVLWKWQRNFLQLGKSRIQTYIKYINTKKKVGPASFNLRLSNTNARKTNAAIANKKKKIKTKKLNFYYEQKNFYNEKQKFLKRKTKYLKKKKFWEVKIFVFRFTNFVFRSKHFVLYIYISVFFVLFL